jgi:hypothetical protein
MIKALGKISIDSSPATVAGIVFNPERDSEWLSGVLSAKVVTGDGIAVGTRILKKAEYFGKRYDAEFEVMEFEPDKRLRLKTDVPLAFEVILQISGDGSRSELEMALVAVGKLPIALPEFIVKRALEESIGRDLKKLKTLAESV